tara:strand:- start:1390 stop:1575 length:186 start_codon:yes stop_codon:yes gene_type:complete
MPIYVFRCKECDEEKEKLQKVNACFPKCENCGCDTEKAIVSSSFALKGEGWEKDGYQKRGR